MYLVFLAFLLLNVVLAFVNYLVFAYYRLRDQIFLAVFHIVVAFINIIGAAVCLNQLL